VIAELQDQLLAQERELDCRKGAIIAWEESLMAFVRALEEARTDHDAIHAHGSDVRCDYFAQGSASSSQSEQSKALNRTLDERVILLHL
jgi:hypothetical protein